MPFSHVPTALVWALLVVVAIFAWIGFLNLTRGTAVRRVRGVGRQGTPVSPSDSQFSLSVATITDTEITGGHRVEIALNGDGTFARLWDDLRSANQSITIQTYYGGQGEVPKLLREILAERVKAGVQVLVLYDGFGTRDISAGDREAYREAGIVAVPFRPLGISTLHLVQNRSHVRGIVIDGKVGWTGGFGIDDKWLGDGHTNRSWRETNVRFEGPAVRQLQSAFATAWAEATGDLFAARLGPIAHDSGTLAGLLYTTPSLGTTVAERFLALSIAGAAKTLYITNSYFAPDINFVGLLCDRARHGVDVRILTAGERTDVRIVRQAGRARYMRLMQAGVRIYEWRPTTLHAKTFVVDGRWTSIGSMNFDNRSLVLNDETTLMVLDDRVGRQMDEIFVDDLRHADEMSLQTFSKRPIIQRAGERLSTLVTRLL